ncbi:MAG: hypothetical protein ACK52S_11665 [Pirellula sp.]
MKRSQSMMAFAVPERFEYFYRTVGVGVVVLGVVICGVVIGAGTALGATAAVSEFMDHRGNG